MHLTVSNNNFQVRLKERNTSIYIESKNLDTYILAVPIDLPENELTQFLKINGSKLIKAFEDTISDNKANYINLYEEQFICMYKPTILTSYRINKKIFTNLKTLNTANISKLNKAILYQDITNLIGIWEERLDCLIDCIHIKNYKNKMYKSIPIDKVIEFSILLKNKRLDYLGFVVAKAVFDYLQLEEDKQIQLLDKYINNWKHFNKIFEYEK